MCWKVHPYVTRGMRGRRKIVVIRTCGDLSDQIGHPFTLSRQNCGNNDDRRLRPPRQPSGMEAVCEKCTLRRGIFITGDANLEEKDLPSFDFTRSGRLGVCELMVERRQELRFFDSLTHSCQFAISTLCTPSADLSSSLPACRELFSARLRAKLSAPPAKVRPLVVFSPARRGSPQRARCPRRHSLFRERSRRPCGRLPE